MDLYHNIDKVSKIIRFGGNRINRYRIPFIQERIIKNSAIFLNDKDVTWYKNRLSYATVDIKDIDEAQCILDSEKVINGSIEILGGFVSISEHTQWNTDFKSGFVWNNGIHFQKYKTVYSENNSDVKNVWELSRCHFLLWIAAAYKSTKNEMYAKKVIEIISDWIDSNPYEKSINWTCSMEVAIRAVNWIFALSIISDNRKITAQMYNKIFTSLYMHGFHVYANLEDDFPYSANHFLSDIAGLLFLGFLFDENTHGIEWRDYSLKTLLYEARTQILPSGVHYEKSISYHRLTTEIFFYCYLLIKKNKPEYLSLDFVSRIRSLTGFIVSYTKPNGKAPLIADNDNGRFLPFVNRDYCEHMYLIELFQKYGLLDCIPNKEIVFPDAGMCFIQNNHYYVNFINSGISKYYKTNKKGIIGTHTHLDALSFELSKGNKDFIVDPGSYAYTMDQELRNQFRSTIKHNSLSVDNLSPYELRGCFFIKYDEDNPYLEPSEIVLKKNDSFYIVSSQFKWQNKKVIHNRTITVNENHIRIEDNIQTEDSHLFTFSFHLDPAVQIISKTEDSVTLKNEEESLNFYVSSNDQMNMTIEEDTYSPSYGVLLQSKTIRVCITKDKDYNIRFDIE